MKKRPNILATEDDCKDELGKAKKRILAWVIGALLLAQLLPALLSKLGL